MNAKIYHGKNALENWLIDTSSRGSNMRRAIPAPPKSVTLNNTRRAFKDADRLSKRYDAKIENDTKYAQVGGMIGGAIAAGLYSLSYPVTFVDGPLPFVDAAWIYGLLRVSNTGYDIGYTAGSWLD